MLFSLEGGLPKDASLLPDRHRFEPPRERPGPSFRPYAAECVEGEFSEVSIHDPEYRSLSGRGYAANVYHACVSYRKEAPMERAEWINDQLRDEIEKLRRTLGLDHEEALSVWYLQPTALHMLALRQKDMTQEMHLHDWLLDQLALQNVIV